MASVPNSTVAPQNEAFAQARKLSVPQNCAVTPIVLPAVFLIQISALTLPSPLAPAPISVSPHPSGNDEFRASLQTDARFQFSAAAAGEFVRAPVVGEGDVIVGSNADVRAYGEIEEF